MTPVPSLTVTVLGCGASAGVPRIGNDWGRCDPSELRNRRTRSSILIQSATTNLLVDTGPDLRQQLLTAGVARIDAILWTHAHGDHINGIDEVRQLNRRMDAVIPAYGSGACLSTISQCFPHVFKPLPPNLGFVKPTLTPHSLAERARVVIGDLPLQTLSLDHGFGMRSLGLRIGDFAYCTDVVALREDNFADLSGIRTWIVDCLGHRAHPTHSHLAQTLAWVERLGVSTAFLTHMDIDMDFDQLRRSLPPHIQPAYDGMRVEVENALV
ncbi:MAG: MBL fold metallo-hydrolase [Alphaproteobacteria bacterium]|nr:MBL fold metallo-hydrolase [Alphaproteobacteria bacterium]